MQPEEVTAFGALEIVSQRVYLLTSHIVEHEGLPQGQSQGQGQLSPPLGPSPQAPCVASVLPARCWTLEVGVAVLLMTLAAVVILALLYWALLLRHKLKVARAGNALEYWGFFRSAQYNLKEPGLPEAFPVAMTTVVTPGPDVAAPPATDSLKPPLGPPPPQPLSTPPQHWPPPPYLEPPPPPPPPPHHHPPPPPPPPPVSPLH
ncbi:disintegrin and metalloproteinase domain-containing protein 15 [Alosa alosa]|uniref:disintegrin and metalloproteinase domain-containing protein 15 n=1 Tax=Alosa alosa TaxID=278164 RepID=UPI0020152CE7|nr:disintegrin and metalloproteinase domain-containing protein 15 [Alosa alosa]XP_048115285.1 disintegrin and metalloproteinase domain-containing protein 15 [Alosa alosa]XP_048115286.1 disintegrin and metalloproteinase domain-containing protein 15 [Alosa alosa]